MNKKINFFKIFALLLITSQTNLFAPKGGGVCSSSGDNYSGRGDCYSGFGSGHCAEPCVGSGGYNAGDRESNSQGGGGSSSGGHGGGSGYDGSVAAPAISSAAAVATAGREFLDQCYMVYGNRQAVKACSKKDVLYAAANVAALYADAAAGKITDDAAHRAIMGLISVGIPLDCALARSVPAQLQADCNNLLQAQAGSAPFIFSLNEARQIIDASSVEQNLREFKPMHEIMQERLAEVSQAYNEVIKGTKTVVQAQQALETAVAQGMPRAALHDVVVATASKVKREIEHEVAEYQERLSRPKRLNAGLLSSATTIHGGIYDLPQAEREALIHQFGEERWLIRAIELASKKCASNGRMHAFCYAANWDRPDLIAKFDAMTKAELNNWNNEVLDFYRRERASGAI